MGRQLQWRAIAPGLLYEAEGDGGRRFVIAADGRAWALELLIDREYQTEFAVNPQPAPALDDAKRSAQEWESELW